MPPTAIQQQLKRLLDEIKTRLDSTDSTLASLVGDVEAIRERYDRLEKVQEHLMDLVIEFARTQQTLTEMQNHLYQVVIDLGNKTMLSKDDLNELRRLLSELLAWRDSIVRPTRMPSTISYKHAVTDADIGLAWNSLAFSFDPNELLEVILDMGIDQSEIEGDTHKVRCKSIIDWCVRRGSFWVLIRKLMQLRPDSLWPINPGDLLRE